MKTESWIRSFFLLLLVGPYSLNLSPAWGGTPDSPEKALLTERIHYAKLPISFEANRGQTDRQVKYLARGRDYTLWLTSDCTILSLRGEVGSQATTSVLRLTLRRPNASSSVRGEQPLPGHSNYFIGNDPTHWHTQIPTYGQVRYEKVYPGVDLVYYGRQGELENDFLLGPGADPSAITWRVDGAETAYVDTLGDLVLSVEGKEVRLRRPRAYQTDGSDRREVPVRYRLRGRQVGFVLGNYDRRQSLVIDPVLSYSTFLGGSGGDVAYAMAIDSAGDAYVAGSTGSTNFPLTSTTLQAANAGSGDVFISKLNPTGTGLLFSVYLGGNGADTPSGIALDTAGNVYVVGATYSINFPITTGAYQTLYGGNGDAFLVKLKPDASALIYSTYLGGSGTDYASALALDAAGDVYLAGSTQSKDFPTMNALQVGNDGGYDAFVAEIVPSIGAAQQLVYSTYLGGSSADYATAITLDTSGHVYVGGYTYSTDFPTQSALQSALAGGSDVFITELVPGNTSLIFSTYFGGGSIDRLFAMTVDAVGSIYLVGDTQSTNFPVSANAFQVANNGNGDGFAAKITPGATALVYSTLLGGSGTDQISAIALDPAGNVYLTGFTQSSDFPLVDAFQKLLGLSGAGTCGSTPFLNVPASALCADAFVTKLGPSGIPVYSTYLGGSGTDAGQAIVVDSTGTAYVAGYSASPNFPATPGAFQWSLAGSSTSSNAFVAKVLLDDSPGLAINPQQVSFGNQALNSTSDPTLLSLTNEGSGSLTISSITVGSGFTQTNNCGTSLPGGGSTCTVQVTFSPTVAGQVTDEVTITDSGPGSPHQVTITGNGVLSAGSLALLPKTLSFSSQAVDTTSPPQTVSLINNGNTAVTITSIVASGDFAQTNNCGSLPTGSAVLNVGQSCSIAVTFTPTGSTAFTGSVTITSNAASPTTSVSLSGNGAAAFSLSANTRSSVVAIGTTSANFSVTATAPTSFGQAISLTCGGSGVTCAFSPSTITAGQASNITVNGLTASSANPLNLTVTGTSGQQTATVALTIFFADFSVSATPLGTTVTAGNVATYTIDVTPLNGLNQVVLLDCVNLPVATTCTVTPPAASLTGTGMVAATLTVQTTAQSRLFRWRPKGGAPPGIMRWRLWSIILTLLMSAIMAWRRWGAHHGLNPRLVLLSALLILAVLGAGCDVYYNPINITPVVNGTPTGNYTVTVRGTLGTNSTVQRAVTVKLSVAP